MRLIKDHMTTKVEVVRPESSIQEAARKMKELNIGVLPVLEGERLVGIITDRDITVRATAQGLGSKETKVRQIMTPRVESCFDDEDVGDAAAKMEEGKIRRLAIVDHNQKLVGIVSLGDLAVRGSSSVACQVLGTVVAAAG